MRNAYCVLLLWSSLIALVASFTSLDHEIFRLKDEITAAEGADVTFYDFVGVSPSASQDEITKASRKRARQLHPDKVKQSVIAARAKATRKPILGKKKPGVNVNKAPSELEIQREVDVAQKKYGRLKVITEVLKGPGRERYDYFLAHGFPAWRGTGYYYARFRPGLGSVLVGLFVIGGGAAHYGAMYLSWKRQREFVERYIRHARRSAWGDESGIRGIPGLDGNVLGASSAPPPSQASFAQENGNAVLNRRQKRAQEKEAKKDAKKGKTAGNSGTSTPVEVEPTPTVPQGAKKRVQAENGKVLIVDSLGRVYLEEEDENGDKGEFLLDPDEIPQPTIRDTILYRLPVWVYGKAKTRIYGEEKPGRKLGTASEGETEEVQEEVKEKTSSSNGSTSKKGKRK